MKFTLILIVFSSFCFGGYEKGKIDMHGGKEDYSYGKRNFEKSQKSLMMRGLFSDQNRSKKTPSK